MKLSEICIRRPVLAWVLTLVLILVGIVAGGRLSVQQYPKAATERPYVTIETQLHGSGPEVIEAQVTGPIEEALAGLDGSEAITSFSSNGESKVSIEIRPGYSIDNVINDIRERLAKNENKLPREATRPTLTRSRAEERPTISVALTSPTMSTGELHDFAKREIEKELEGLKGVARVDTLGANQYEMKIFLDPVLLAIHKVTVLEVYQALQKQSVEQAAGKIISRNREYLVTTVAKLEKPEEFQLMVVANKGGNLVRLRDIGYVRMTTDDLKTKALYNGKSAISLSVIKQSNANPIEVSKVVRAQLKNIEKILPEGMTVEVSNDTATFIEKSIKEVYKTIWEATALVILVVLFFLRSARASVIPLVTIPVSLIGSLFLMYVLEFSINIFTLMALVLAIGLVVDDAIVVLENVYRYIERGMKPFKAAFEGIREISFAVIGMTLTLAAVYAPVALAQGMTGKLLSEFSVTLAGAVMISGFVALTLSPMMCARMLSSHDTPQRKTGVAAIGTWIKDKIRTDILIDKVEIFYEKFLRNLLENFKSWIIGSALIFACIGGLVFFYLPSELSPKEDRGNIFIEGSGPQTATRDYTERYVNQIDKILAQTPEVERRIISINNPSYDLNVQLKQNRERPTDVVARFLKETLGEKVTGVEVTTVDTGASGSLGGNPIISFVIRANKSYRELKDIVTQISMGLYQSGVVTGVTSEVRGDTEDYVISILRDKASSLNIDLATIADTVEMLLKGKKANLFKKENKLYEVRLEIHEEFRKTIDNIAGLYVKAGDKEGTLVPLSELIRIAPRSGPMQIHRHNRMRAVAINAWLKRGVSVGEGIKKLDEISKEVLPQEARMDYTGDTKRFLTESNTMLLVFGLALCFIYLVMAAQFESWRDPLIIMLSVPLSIAGALVTLGLIPDGSLNLYSNIGLVTLIGLITKHGILMVEFANSLRQQGLAIFEAIVQSCRMRLRPILMTTFAMVLGAIPLALASGAGAESRRQLGWTIVGGMSIGTLFTLFVIPAFYILMTKRSVEKTADNSLMSE